MFQVKSFVFLNGPKERVRVLVVRTRRGRWITATRTRYVLFTNTRVRDTLFYASAGTDEIVAECVHPINNPLFPYSTRDVRNVLAVVRTARRRDTVFGPSAWSESNRTGARRTIKTVRPCTTDDDPEANVRTVTVFFDCNGVALCLVNSRHVVERAIRGRLLPYKFNAVRAFRKNRPGSWQRNPRLSRHDNATCTRYVGRSGIFGQNCNDAPASIFAVFSIFKKYRKPLEGPTFCERFDPFYCNKRKSPKNASNLSGCH